MSRVAGFPGSAHVSAIVQGSTDVDPAPSEHVGARFPREVAPQGTLAWGEWEQPEGLPEEGAPQEPEAAELEPVRVYLNEISRVPLLTRDQEIDLGRRIETAQRDLLGTLGAIPLAIRRLVELAHRIRTQSAAFEELIAFSNGREVDVAEALRVLRAFARVGRLAHRLDEISSRFSVSSERIRQIEAAAMKKLRRARPAPRRTGRQPAESGLAAAPDTRAPA